LLKYYLLLTWCNPLVINNFSAILKEFWGNLTIPIAVMAERQPFESHLFCHAWWQVH